MCASYWITKILYKTRVPKIVSTVFLTKKKTDPNNIWEKQSELRYKERNCTKERKSRVKKNAANSKRNSVECNQWIKAISDGSLCLTKNSVKYFCSFLWRLQNSSYIRILLTKTNKSRKKTHIQLCEVRRHKKWYSLNRRKKRVNDILSCVPQYLELIIGLISLSCVSQLLDYALHK